MIRDDIKAAQIAAMKGGDKARLATIRLMLAKIKDRDIELRVGTAPGDDDVVVTDVLQKMVKQRRESIALYEQGGRRELADIEAAENTDAKRISAGERYASVYNIDYSRCIFCGYCVEACPTDAITHGHGFELAPYNINELLYRKEKLLESWPKKLAANA